MHNSFVFSRAFNSLLALPVTSPLAAIENCLTAVPHFVNSSDMEFENKTVDDVSDWLISKGFSEGVVSAFSGTLKDLGTLF